MLLYRRRAAELAARDHFSFSSPVSDHLEYGTWAQKLRTLDDSFSKRKPQSEFGPYARTIRLPSVEGSNDDSSPPLWKSASPIPRPTSQIIEKYRHEMMDLARDLPETDYELSLRDMVELKQIHRSGKEEEEASLTERLEVSKEREKRRVRKVSRTGSMDSGGFLLKLFLPSFPAVLGGSRKISPRTITAGDDGEWINGRLRERSSSNGSQESTDSSCRSRGRKKWKFGGCYSFCYRHRRSRSR
ncbi:uncharacterized protein LOC110018154 isoform X1 [Phalaenopsis equestris]|uniref:uncharacterized protein LOC110018154 isoform X1 n=1 Tax=Phalaenopsis equestris TaxID=78828 RepID=UPI0009E385EB|nr:uncharacterized protein LOC110018154 isoform X1 [Phalaenopsis equestris]